MVQTIALVDDDRNLLTGISIALEREGYKVQTYIDGESALIGLTRNPPDLAVVDIKMPRMDGEELLKKLKKKMSIPIIFLTSKDEEVDELLGLKLGADDFVKKSGGFSMKVLIERIRVQLRKKTDVIDDSKNIINHGKLRLDSSQLECEWGGKPLPDKLTTTEFLIVKELAKRPGVIKERAHLMDIAYKENSEIEDRTIDTANNTALARKAEELGLSKQTTLIVRGLDDHVNFINHPDPVIIQVLEIIPPEPPKLLRMVQHVLTYADLPPIRLEVQEIDIRDLADNKQNTEALLVPCRSSGLDFIVPTYYLDEHPKR